jgi:uncharacterized protein (DUF2147 family)
VVNSLAQLLVPILTLAHLPADADPVDGTWRSPPRTSGAYLIVEIGPCADAPAKRCGVVVSAHNGARPETVGRQVIRGMELQPDGTWQGEVIQPLKEQVYKSRVVPAGRNVMRVQGCVIGGLICTTQEWTRVR